MSYAPDNKITTSCILHQNRVDVKGFARIVGLCGLFGGGRY